MFRVFLCPNKTAIAQITAGEKKINRVINENQTFLTSILIGLDELIAHYENDDEIVGRLKDVKKGFESMVKK